MKTGKIIRKNLKLLLRSRVSMLVIILGPLLVIMLVGVSFSTNTFNLNLGVYSEKYSTLSNSFMDKLQQEKYGLEKFETEDQCIKGVKEGLVHACIIFPPEMEIANDRTNVIKFHVDQSQINLVYLVMSTLESSFGERTSEISKDLTNNIVTTLFKTQSGLQESQEMITKVISLNTESLTESDTSISSLQGLDLSPEESSDINIADIQTEMENLLDETTDLVEEGLAALDDLEDYGSLDGNQSDYVDDAQSTFMALNGTIVSRHNTTMVELNKVLGELDEALSSLNEKLETAGSVSTAVLGRLTKVKNNAASLKQESADLDAKIKEMVASINAIQITNTESIVSPISTEINPIVQSQSNLGFLFPSLVVMLIMFIGLLLPSTLIIMDKNSRAYFRTFITPTRSSLFIIATYLTSMLLLVFQISIILLVSQFYFKMDFLNALPILILTMPLIITFFILLGMLIGYIFNTEEMAMLASVSIGTLFLLTSGIIFPMESMPEYIIDKAKFNPVVLGADMFRRSILFDSDLASIKTPFFYMFAFSLLLVILILAVKKSKKIEFILRKPGKLKIKKDWLMNQFDFGDRKAKTLAEFIVSIQNMKDEKYKELTSKSAFRDWLVLVYKNRYLGDKIHDSKNKQEMLNVLVEELKKISEKDIKK